jgi:hypothetical protein
VGGELSVGQKGQEKCTGENKNTHTISVGNPERKRQFGRFRAK